MTMTLTEYRKHQVDGLKDRRELRINRNVKFVDTQSKTKLEALKAAEERMNKKLSRLSLAFS